ncbi:MAG: cytidylate kinase family protein [Dehalococcoidia bacterium]
MAIITISRGTYSGGRELAEYLAGELGYRLMSHEELFAIAAGEFGVSEKNLENALMHKPGLLERLGLKRIHYLASITSAMTEAVQSDNVVYYGYGGHLLIQGVPHHLRVKILANMEYRIKLTMGREGIGRKAAIQHIHQIDEEREKWCSSVYGFDRNDLSLYDLALNLERIGIPDAGQTIITLARIGFKTTPQYQKILDDMVLANRIRARIALDPDISDDHIEVETSEGLVTFKGEVPSVSEADKCREIALQFPEVQRIDSKMRIR